MKEVLVCFRLAAAALLIGVAVPSLASQPLVAKDGGCLPKDDYLCLTADPETDPYADKYCASGQGVDCITCFSEPEAICSSFGQDSDEGWYNNSR